MNQSGRQALELTMKNHAALVATFLDIHFKAAAGDPPGQVRLIDSIRYSSLQSGSKRFRPVLAMLTAEALGLPAARVLPFAAAVECVHTYSLIHDDLPAMDDDDFRRGEPTNHKKFDEATAILAGDALLTEAFQILADAFSEEPANAVKVIREVARASGVRGMVGGQAVDMAAKKQSVSLDDLRILHQQKTGALIRVSAAGAALLCHATPAQLGDIETYAQNLGLAFQVADDLLDHDPRNPEPGSYPGLLGREKTVAFLDDLTEICLSRLEAWPLAAEPLRQIAIYNRSREK